MKMSKREKEIKNMIFSGLDNIPKESVKISKAWDINNGKSISIVALKEILDKSKITNGGDETLDIFVAQYNKTLGTFYNTCVKASKKMGGKAIPIENIRILIRQIKNALYPNS